MILVSNLSNEGPGSLRQCLEVETGPRICLPTVSGTISLQDFDIVIRHDYVTYDGTGMPLALKDGGIYDRASHVILRHLRIRPGPSAWYNRGTNANGITTNGYETGGATHDHIYDHCSISWGTDDLVAVIGGSDNVTVQWSLIYESLECSTCQNKGLLIQAGNVSVHHSLYAHTYIRWPEITQGSLDFVNNVKFDGNGTDVQINPVYGPVLANFVGNYFKDGPNAWQNNLGHNEIRAIGWQPYSAASGIYLQDNHGRYTPAGAAMPLSGVASPPSAILWDTNGVFPVQTQRYPYPQVTTTSAQHAYDEVLNQAGAFPRDSTDARVVADVRNSTGIWPKDPSEVGGWPVLASGTPPPDADHDGMPDAWETAHGLNPNDPSDGPQDTTGDGYTNIEEYLNQVAR
ncbi:MAG: hypothetical protein ACT4OO_03235 [Nitrospiraceae bacterium]